MSSCGGRRKMAKGGFLKVGGASKRTIAQKKAIPYKKGGAVRGMGAATKGAGKGPWG